MTIITPAFPRTHLNQWVDQFLSKSRDLTLSLLPDTLPNTYSPLSMSVRRIFPNTYTLVRTVWEEMWNRCSAGGSVSRDDKRREEERRVGGGQESRELELRWVTN